MFKIETYRKHLIGREIEYRDQVTGTSWDIEILDIYVNENSHGYTLRVTDGVKVNLDYSDFDRPQRVIIDKILETYKKSLE